MITHYFKQRQCVCTSAKSYHVSGLLMVNIKSVQAIEKGWCYFVMFYLILIIMKNENLHSVYK